MLAATLRTTLQSEAGIVFGKVPAGWSVQFSGRAERPLFITTYKQFISADSMDRERYFIFLNAAPGTQTLQLIGSHANSGGITTLPVFAGTATYIDLSTSSYKTISGYVRDAATVERLPLKAARVQVMGQPGSAVWTDAKGYFHLRNVLVIANHPVQLDIQAAIQDVQTHAHRFSVYSDQVDGQDYFLFSEADLRAWEDALQGSVNPDAGTIVGAAPGLARAQNRYYASATSYIGLPPEVYSLAPSGQPLPKAPLDSESPRFLSLQVSEGPTLIQLTDEADQGSLSELVYASPRTVNIVSFY
jgi:hypothetical protein